MDSKYTSVLGSKILYSNFNDQCFSFQIIDNNIQRNQEDEFFSMHEEADNRMIFHTKVSGQYHAMQEIVMQSSDTDVLVILLGVFQNFPKTKIWLKTRTLSSYRYININSLVQELGLKTCKALPFLHAFTGSDFTAVFAGKGKLKPFKIMVHDCAMRCI